MNRSRLVLKPVIGFGIWAFAIVFVTAGAAFMFWLIKTTWHFVLGVLP